MDILQIFDILLKFLKPNFYYDWLTQFIINFATQNMSILYEQKIVIIF
jgi:hypothetical protein